MDGVILDAHGGAAGSTTRLLPTEGPRRGAPGPIFSDASGVRTVLLGNFDGRSYTASSDAVARLLVGTGARKNAIGRVLARRLSWLTRGAGARRKRVGRGSLLRWDLHGGRLLLACWI